MRSGITFQLSPEDRVRLEEIVAERNTPQKHVWRAQIVLLSAADTGTVEIMRRTGQSKPTVWRWQQRFMDEGVTGLLRDKTRPPGKPPLAPAVINQVLTKTESPPDATHWSARAMAKAVGISPRSVQRIWAGHGLKPHLVETFKVSNDPRFAEKLVAGCTSIPRTGSGGRREKPDPGARPHPAGTAAQKGTGRHDDARLQAQRHHHAVRRAQRAGRHRDRPVHGPSPPSGVHPVPGQGRPRHTGRSRPAFDRRQLCHSQASQRGGMA